MRKAAAVRLSKTYYRRKLLEKRSEFQGAMRHKLEALCSGAKVAEEDQAPASYDEYIWVKMNGLERSHLRLVDEALERLEAGGFGECSSCGEPIPSKRLKALPWARYCVACQEALGRNG